MIDPTKFVKLYGDVWANPIWAGKFPAQAWRVYCWLLDKTTSEKTVNGVSYGLVLGKAPVSYLSIARDLGCSWCSVQRCVIWLKKNRLVNATRAGVGQEYRYTITNSRKFNNGKSSASPAPKAVDDSSAKPATDYKDFDLSGLDDEDFSTTVK
jgi:hypothetical protein